ncbi:MAG: 2-oxoglutarate dehydrogenase complex dihydrolipoyllysine-residue succinyltransferase [Candidatus Dadabacteria bacterium]|nr:2-oxoglutarate dehydrogenase complex dihydrolipoyllysine-residue succinyltransferase [Candidatus Dadabacteria bacterium]NIS07295.1 2-oxoglutarate dehydrogenase complex dihydrolipoyllysine-residue succinyltransferase [Candidatus Dadabacteria bacterium]NIY21570.1 2-oxoglutarate dehydrogenase complex dihydrolipoyllysine-residue succinyltransferase [Candidatus Dadabacteria bacterium]
MSKNIVVPELGESVVEATVIRWIKNEGEAVAMGETLVELETEKANFEVAAEAAGVLEKIIKNPDEDVEIGDVLGTISENGAAGAEVIAEPVKAAEPEPVQTAQTKQAEDSEVKITPVARKLIEQSGLNASDISGKGPNEKITKEDVENYIKSASAAKEQPAQPRTEAAQPAPSAPSTSVVIPEPESDGREQRVKMSARRRTIARRMLEAQAGAAILTTFNEVDMGPVMELRNRRKESFQAKYGVKLGFTSFFVKAVIGALKEFPAINAEIQDDYIVYKNYYDIGMAIGAEGGLVVPVLRDCDRMTFADIERAVIEYVEKANNGTLSLQELRGGTFTITNGGVFGSLMSTPILNPPQVGILGMHKIEQRPVAAEGEIVIRPMMYTALSYDHRIVDGKEAVLFLVKIKELIEDPEVLLLEG